MNRLSFIAFALASLGTGMVAHAQEASFSGPEKISGDFLYVLPLLKPHDEVAKQKQQNKDSLRLQLGIDPLHLNTSFAELSFAETEAMIGMTLVDQRFEVSRFRSILMRFKFSRILNPLDLGTFFRNTDRAIDYGVDVLSMRFPIAIGKEGNIIVKPGLDLGVHHYEKPIDDYYFTTTASIDLSAKATLIENWLGAGLMARIRYDLDTSKISGFGLDQTLYLSLVLVQDSLYARVYAGADEQPKRAEVGLPEVNFFTGLGLLGQF